MADPIRLKVITGQYQAPEGLLYFSRLVDGAGVEVDGRRLQELHRGLLATGYCVMLRVEYLGYTAARCSTPPARSSSGCMRWTDVLPDVV